MTIDLSCDLGEATDDTSLELEARIWPLITSANIACGGHVGDEASMRAAVRNAIANEVTIGAHPSYPDREHFGRQSLAIAEDALHAALTSQLQGLDAIAASEGGKLAHAKPHGALYNDAHRDSALAAVIVDVCLARQLAVVASPGSAVEREALARGCRVILEGFADRRYRSDGSLQPRSERDSLILDLNDAAMQAVRLAKGKTIVAADGREIHVECETICIHSDLDGALERLQKIRTMLEACGVAIAAPG